MVINFFFCCLIIHLSVVYMCRTRRCPDYLKSFGNAGAYVQHMCGHRRRGILEPSLPGATISSEEGMERQEEALDVLVPPVPPLAPDNSPPPPEVPGTTLCCITRVVLACPLPVLYDQQTFVSTCSCLTCAGEMITTTTSSLLARR